MNGTLDNITIVLVGTKHPGNIGAAARAMRNMGLRHLRLAAPQCRLSEEAVRMAKAGAGILENARRFTSLAAALRGLRLVVGTTGKTGGNRERTLTPRACAPLILRQAAAQRVGIVFGPEDTGLVDEHLMLCQRLIRIPADPEARSLNLAQAVLIVGYELFLGRLENSPARPPRLAPVEQTEAMYAQLEQALLQIGFLQSQNAKHMMFRLRRLLGRAGLERRDVGILRGLARQIAWFGARKPEQ